VGLVTLNYHLLRRTRKESSSECRVCGKKSKLIAESIKVCVDCLRESPEESFPYVMEAHARIRTRFGLPAQPPRTSNGISCNVCANECRIGDGETSFCGLKRNIDGRLHSLTNPRVGLLNAYLDSQVTNCCAAWFCPAGTGAGYPQYAYRRGPEYGYYNLAIFFYGCNFDCLFCQNASHKNVLTGEAATVKDLVAKTRSNRSISCWCFFGGSPEPQLPFAIKASETALQIPDRILRICFEWNGCGNPELVRRAAELSLVSGGNMKFDLKCFDPTISYALSGVSNQRAYENFNMIAEEFYPQRPDLPLLTATTLLVPGYVDTIEVEQIAKFIADLNPEIPYSLLTFHPDFMMKALPVTPLDQAIGCYKAAEKHLDRVNVGNLRTLGIRNMEEFKAKVYGS
jgi:pyruvate formate lyase activating enzyme